MTARYKGSGFFPASANGSLVTNYAFRGGTISDPNPKIEFPGSRFSQRSTGFDESESNIGIRVNARDDTDTVVKFEPGINLILAPANSAFDGSIQLESAEFRFNTAARC